MPLLTPRLLVGYKLVVIKVEMIIIVKYVFLLNLY